MSLNSVVNSLVRAAAGIPSDITDAELDAHVAKLLAEEAKTREVKWGELGLGGLLGTSKDSPDPHAPKPNKPFLASVIRTVDGHNTALINEQSKAARGAREDRYGADERTPPRRSRMDGGGASSRLFGGAMRGLQQDDMDRSKRRRRDDDGDWRQRRDKERSESRSRSRDRARNNKHRNRGEEVYEKERESWRFKWDEGFGKSRRDFRDREDIGEGPSRSSKMYGYSDTKETAVPEAMEEEDEEAMLNASERLAVRQERREKRNRAGSHEGDREYRSRRYEDDHRDRGPRSKRDHDDDYERRYREKRRERRRREREERESEEVDEEDGESRRRRDRADHRQEEKDDHRAATSGGDLELQPRRKEAGDPADDPHRSLRRDKRHDELDLTGPEDRRDEEEKQPSRRIRQHRHRPSERSSESPRREREPKRETEGLEQPESTSERSASERYAQADKPASNGSEDASMALVTDMQSRSGSRRGHEQSTSDAPRTLTERVSMSSRKRPLEYPVSSNGSRIAGGREQSIPNLGFAPSKRESKASASSQHSAKPGHEAHSGADNQPSAPPPPSAAPPPPPSDLPPSPPPPSPPPTSLSKMDRYFDNTYDPRLDLGEVPAEGMIAAVGWDNMLAVIKERGERSPSPPPLPPPSARSRAASPSRSRSPSPTTLARRAARKARKARQAAEAAGTDMHLALQSDGEKERARRKEKKRKEKEKLANFGKSQRVGAVGDEGYAYVPKGGIREWDLGK